MPIGPCLEVGILENCFGDANFCVKRSTFEDLGGFTPDRGTGFEDWEFLATLSLKGYSQDVIPEPLLWYRHLDTSMIRTTSAYHNHQRALRPYLDGVSPDMQRIIRSLAVPLYWKEQAGAPCAPPASTGLKHALHVALSAGHGWGQALRSLFRSRRGPSGLGSSRIRLTKSRG